MISEEKAKSLNYFEIAKQIGLVDAIESGINALDEKIFGDTAPKSKIVGLSVEKSPSPVRGIDEDWFYLIALNDKGKSDRLRFYVNEQGDFIKFNESDMPSLNNDQKALLKEMLAQSTS